MRTPILVTVGRGGWTIYFAADEYGSTARHSGYCYERDEAPRACVADGVPLIDTRGLDITEVFRLACSGPLIAQGGPMDSTEKSIFGPAPVEGQGLDGCGYGAMHAAPVAVHAELARARGAIVLNI